MDTTPVTCFGCGGQKKILAMFCVRPAGETGPGAMEMDCPTCHGTGVVSALQAAWRVEGEALRRRRLQLRYGMRAFAEACGILPSTWCDMEQGRLKPEWPRNAPTTPED